MREGNCSLFLSQREQSRERRWDGRNSRGRMIDPSFSQLALHVFVWDATVYIDEHAAYYTSDERGHRISVPNKYPSLRRWLFLHPVVPGRASSPSQTKKRYMGRRWVASRSGTGNDHMLMIQLSERTTHQRRGPRRERKKKKGEPGRGRREEAQNLDESGNTGFTEEGGETGGIGAPSSMGQTAWRHRFITVHARAETLGDDSSIQKRQSA